MSIATHEVHHISAAGHECEPPCEVVALQQRVAALEAALQTLRLHHADAECSTERSPWPQACETADEVARLSLLAPEPAP